MTQELREVEGDSNAEAGQTEIIMNADGTITVKGVKIKITKEQTEDKNVDGPHLLTE